MDTFSTIAQGYGGMQQSLQQLGLAPGSFTPMDGGGSAPQIPTPPPPQFTTVVSTTAPFPGMAPGLGGAAGPPPPMPTIYTRPSMVHSAPQPTMAPPQFMGAQMAPAMMQQSIYSQPVMMPGVTSHSPQSQAAMMGAPLQPSMYQDMRAMSGLSAPVIGQDYVAQRMAASSRMSDRLIGGVASTVGMASNVVGLGGAAASMGLLGAGAAGLGAAAGLVAAPLMAGAAWADSLRNQWGMGRQAQQLLREV